MSSFCAAFCASEVPQDLFALLSAHNMNSSEFIIPQDQIKNNIVTSGFFGKS